MSPNPRLFVFFAILAAGAQAQWLNYAPPGTPRTRDGKLNLAAPAPRTADGKPDLTGVWMHEITPVAEVKRLFGNRFDAEIELAPPGMEIGTQHKYAFDILIDFKGSESPLKPETAKRLRERRPNPLNVCMGVGGFPRTGLLSEPIKIIQAPRITVILYEAGYLRRQIFADGRTLPKEFDLPQYLGYSAGRWEGDTFVVETAGFNGKTTLDGMGRPVSEKMHVTERFRRRDFGHLDVEMTFNDPENYTRPFTIKIPHDLIPDNDIYEMFCNENERDRMHLNQ
ncbi:MAG TPA: hypothetical protein VLM42_05655 [Bryobacteraceae bacterium]|nr:hypothetical protein [Bryobacteraceae bacterium]